jgi:hypothetical protein
LTEVERANGALAKARHFFAYAIAIGNHSKLHAVIPAKAGIQGDVSVDA